MSPCLLCRGCLRLSTNCPSTCCLTYRLSVRCWILAELNRTEHGSATMYVVKDSGACLIGCARLSHCESCCGTPTAFPCRHRCTVDVLAGTHRCAWMPQVASRQGSNPFVVVGVWSCQCLVVVFQTRST